MTKRKALFLDRDGTLIHDAHYLKDPKKLRLLKEFLSLRGLKMQDFFFYAYKSIGIARGYFDWTEGIACNANECIIVFFELMMIFFRDLYCP